MAKYVAFLRSIGPGNPNMRNDRLRSVFEHLGFTNVQSVISSGNVIFETDRTDTKKIELEAEAAFPELLGFTTTVIIHSQAELQDLIDKDPFRGLTHGPSSYLMVTFFRNPTKMPFTLPYQPAGKPYKLLLATDTELFTTTDNTILTTTDLMGWLERHFGKQISSRTWLTLQRVLKKMQSNK